MRRPIVAVGLSLMLLVGCQPQSTPRPEPEPASGPSVFDLDLPLTDATGDAHHLREYAGRPFVATMIYTNCTSVCPRTTADLQRLDRALPDAVRARMRFLLFSLDPERDSTTALAGFARDHALDPTHWSLLRTAPQDVRTLAAVLGVRYRPDAGGEIAHSAVFVVVDAAGVIRHRQVGTQDSIDELTAAVEAVARR